MRDPVSYPAVAGRPHDRSSQRRTTAILAIPGSIRSGSVNRRLLQTAAGLASGEFEVTPWNGLAQVPPFTPDAESLPESVKALREAIAAADALLISTPEYNFSLPGHLKNAIDWASHPVAESAFAGKPAAVIGASADPASEAGWARGDLRRILEVVGARLVGPDLVVLRAGESFSETGRLKDPRQEQTLFELLCGLRDAVEDR